jgi:hypothetical protein
MGELNEDAGKSGLMARDSDNPESVKAVASSESGGVGRKPRKTYWSAVSLRSDRDKAAVSSWFRPLSDGMTPYKAEVLCDIETEQEKKLRVFMRDAAGKEFRLERTYGVKRTTMSRKPLPVATPTAP